MAPEAEPAMAAAVAKAPGKGKGKVKVNEFFWFYPFQRPPHGRFRGISTDGGVIVPLVKLNPVL